MTPQGSKHVVIILTYIITVVLTEISMLFMINLTFIYVQKNYEMFRLSSIFQTHGKLAD